MSLHEGPLISVVIPNYNGAAFLEKCLSSVLNQSYRNVEIVVVDNGSTDSSVEAARRVAPGAVLVRNRSNLGFAGGANRGIGEARGEWVAVLNNDTEAAPEWLAECARAIQSHPEASFLACKIMDLHDPKRIYSAGDCFLRTGAGYRRGQEMEDRPDYAQETEIFAACGCAALYRRAVLENVRRFDERFFAYLEDVDLALRLQALGHRGWYVPGAHVFHVGAATSGGGFSPLAVRLHTRNSVLLLFKSLPGSILRRSCIRIAAAQICWLARVAAHGRIWSYMRGLAGILPLLPAMIRERKELRQAWQRTGNDLWKAILESERMAGKDFVPAQEGTSLLLRWYFRLSS